MRRRLRGGKSLIEALVIISVLSLVLAGSATALITLFRVERQVGRDAEARQGLARLASRFRADAHAAADCHAGDECTLTMPGGEAIRYRADERWLWRERRVADKVEHRDAFSLAPGSEVAFEIEPLGEKQLVKLSIRRASVPLAPDTSETLVQRDDTSETLVLRGVGAPQPYPTVIAAVVNLHGAKEQENSP